MSVLLSFLFVRLLLLVAALWLVAKFCPYGDKVVAVVVACLLLKWLGFFWCILI